MVEKSRKNNKEFKPCNTGESRSLKRDLFSLKYAYKIIPNKKKDFRPEIEYE